MRPDPRVVSADGHDCEIDVSVLAQFRETVRDCSITGEDDPPPISLQQIAVVAAIVIMPLSCAPVFHRKGANIDLAGSSRESLRFAPIELGNVPEPRSSQQIARSTSADNTRVFIKTTERSQIEMVEVRVRKKDKIDLWQLMKLERGRGQSFWTDGESWHANSNAGEKHWVGEDFESEEIDEYSRMTNPGKRHLGIAPLCRFGFGKGWSNRPPAFNCPFTKQMTEPAPDAGATQSWLLRCFHRRSQTALRNFSEPERVLLSAK